MMRLNLESGVRLTRHAREVMLLRDFSADEVADVLRKPEVVLPHRGLWHVKRGELTLVVAVSEDDVIVIVTILLNRAEPWTNADARARN